MITDMVLGGKHRAFKGGLRPVILSSHINIACRPLHLNGRTVVICQVVPVLHRTPSSYQVAYTAAQQEAFSSPWQKLTKGSVSDLCGRVPGRPGYLTWRYTSHYITAGQWVLLVAMNY